MPNSQYPKCRGTGVIQGRPVMYETDSPEERSLAREMARRKCECVTRPMPNNPEPELMERAQLVFSAANGAMWRSLAKPKPEIQPAIEVIAEALKAEYLRGLEQAKTICECIYAKHKQSWEEGRTHDYERVIGAHDCWQAIADRISALKGADTDGAAIKADDGGSNA